MMIPKLMFTAIRLSSASAGSGRIISAMIAATPATSATSLKRAPKLAFEPVPIFWK